MTEESFFGGSKNLIWHQKYQSKFYFIFPLGKKINSLSLSSARKQNSENTAQKTKLSMKDFFCKCDQIRGFLRIWSHLVKKSLKSNFAKFLKTSFWKKHLWWLLLQVLLRNSKEDITLKWNYKVCTTPAASKGMY